MHDPRPSTDRFRAEDLVALASGLLQRCGHPGDRADVTAQTLLEGDLMGHTTHGLQLLPLYLDATRRGPIVAMLQQRFRDTGLRELAIDQIALFRQSCANARFEIIGQWPLTA